jgi:hypothetical protein
MKSSIAKVISGAIRAGYIRLGVLGGTSRFDRREPIRARNFQA